MINIGSLVGTLELQDNATSKLVNFDQALNRTFGPFAQFHRQTQTIGIGLQSFGFQLARTGDRLTALTAGVVATGYAVVKLATDFQTNMTKIVNLTEIGAQGVGKMRDAVLRLSPQVAQGPVALSEALYSIGSVGLTGAKALETLTVSAKATAIGLGDTKEVARAISAAVINYADQNMTAAKAADILTMAVKEGGAEADNFASTLGRVISTGKQVGVSFEEITSSVATFTRLGVRADEAVTALRGTFAFLMKPAAGVVGELKKLGLSMDDVRKSVKERGLAQTLIDLVALTKGNEEVIAKIIPNVRALAGVLANAGSQADSYKDILNKVTNSAGTLNDAFNVVSETAGFKFHQALARLQVLGIQIGDTLLPVLVSVAESLMPVIDMVTKLVSAFDSLPGPVKTATLAFVGFALALGPIMSVWGRLTDAVGFFARGFTGLKNVFLGVSGTAARSAIDIERAFSAVWMARLLGLFRQFEEYANRARVVGVAAPGGVGFPTTSATVATRNLLLTESAMHHFGQEVTRLAFPLSRVVGLLGEATVPLARFNIGWALAKDSYGNFAKQLQATNPTWLVHTELLDKAVISTGEFTLAAMEGAKTVTSEVFTANREILRLSSSIQAIPGGVVRVTEAFVPLTKAITQLGEASVEAARITDPTRLLTGLPQMKLLTGATEEAAKAAENFQARFIGLPRGIEDTAAAVDKLGARFIGASSTVRDTTVEVGRLGQRLLTTGSDIAVFEKNAGLAVRSIGQVAETSITSTRAILTLAEALGLVSQALDIAIVGEIAVRTLAFIGDSTDVLNETLNLYPKMLSDLASGFKSMAIIGVHAFEDLIDAIINFRNTANKEFPTISNLIAAGFVVAYLKVKETADLIELAAQRAADLTVRPVTLDTVLQEARGREARASGASKPFEATDLQKRQLAELIDVYNQLTTTVDASGHQFLRSAEASEVLAEKFKKLKDAGVAIPKEIEIFLKITTIGAGAGGADETPTIFSEFLAKAREAAAESGIAARRFGEDMDTLRAKTAQADKEYKGLSKTVKDDIGYALKSNRFDISDIVKANEAWFSSSEIAEIAIKGLSNTHKAAMKEAERDTRWITTFQNQTKDLEAKLKAAYEQGVPVAIIMEEFGTQAERANSHTQMLGGTLGKFTAQALSDFAKIEARKPFEEMQTRADKLETVIGAAIANGTTIAQVYAIWGNAAVDVAEKSEAMSLTVGKNLADLKAYAEKLALDQIFARFDEEVHDFQRSMSRTSATAEEIDELNIMAAKWAESAKERAKVLKESGQPQTEINRLLREENDILKDKGFAYVANMKAIKDSTRALEDMARALAPDTLGTRLDDVSIKFQRMREDISKTEKSAENYAKRISLNLAEEVRERDLVFQAWLRGNAKIKTDLEALARDAVVRYELMRKSGLFAAKDIEEAWLDMVKKVVDASDQWTGKFVELVGNMPEALSKAFADMMAEAKTFKEFFTGIWKSIQSEIYKVFQNIVATFIRQVLQKMLASLFMNKGSMAAAFAGLITGGTPAAAGGIPGVGDVLNNLNVGGAGGVGVPLGGNTSWIGKDIGSVNSSVFGGFWNQGGGLLNAGKTNWGAVAGGGLMALGGAMQWKGAGDSKLQNMLGGAQTGAGIGMMVGGPMGMAVGAGVGAIVGLISSAFRKPEHKKIMEDVGKHLGVDISEGLAKEIEELEKTIEGGTKNQRRAMAELLSVDKIIEEGGGLNQKNVRSYEILAGQLFAPIAQGGKVGKQALETLNTLIGKFSEQADKTGGLWDKNFKTIITRAQELKLDMANLTAIIDAQINKLSGGLGKLAASFGKDVEKALKDIEENKNKLGGLAAGLQPEFDRLARIAFAAFNTIIAQGKSAIEAIDAVGDTVDKLIEAHDKLKLKGSAAYDALARFRNLVKDNRELIDAASGLNDVILALSNLGGVTADLFKDLQIEGIGIYDRLRAAGFTANEALRIMKPSLETIIRLAKEHGYAIDANTQKLIDEADAQGILDKNALTTNEIMMTGFAAIIKALGGEMPAAFRSFADKALIETGRVGRGLDDLTRPRRASLTVDVETHAVDRPGTTTGGGTAVPRPGGTTSGGTGGGTTTTGGVINRPPPTSTGGAGGGSTGGGGDHPSTLASGGIVSARNIIPFPNLVEPVQFKSYGTDTVPAMLTPGEMVLTPQDQLSLFSMLKTPERDTTPASPPSAGVTINIEERAFDGVLNGATVDSPERARELAYAIVNELEKRGKLWNRTRNALGVAS